MASLPLRDGTRQRGDADSLIVFGVGFESVSICGLQNQEVGEWLKGKNYLTTRNRGGRALSAVEYSMFAPFYGLWSMGSVGSWKRVP